MSFFSNKESIKGKKSIVIYFSRADENYAVGYVDKGNTEYIVEYIREITGAELFRVDRAVPYSAEYKKCCDEALVEKNNNERPAILKTLPNIDDYEVIYIGYPIYWGTLPMPMFTQLEKLNWQGKIVKFFSTHEGSGLGSSENDIREICQGAKILPGMEIRGSMVKTSKAKIENWINQ